MFFFSYFSKWSRPDWAFVVLVALFLLPAIFGGGREDFAQGIILALTALLIILVPGRPSFGHGISRFIFYSVLVFLVAIFISIFFSFDRHETIRGFLIFSAAIVIFLKSVIIFEKPGSTERFFWWLLIGTVLFSLYGLYVFIGTNPLFRLGSVFYQQNAFAGFMLPTLFFVAGSVFYSIGWKKKLLFSALGMFLALVFFLTFARGATLAFFSAFIITGLLFWWPLRTWWRRGVILLLVVAAGTVLAFWVFQVKNRPTVEGQGRAESVAVVSPSQFFDYETVNENGLAVRFHYLYDAGRIFSYHPLTGVGWGAFGDAFMEYRRELRFYTTDPHNMIARAFVELGILGGLALVSILTCLLVLAWRVAKAVRTSPQAEFRAYIVIGSWLSLFFQNFVNTDWMFPSDLILFWVVAGMLVCLSRSFSSNPEGTELRVSPWGKYLVGILGMALALVGLVLTIASSYFSQASMALSEGQIGEALTEYNSAVRFDPWNPLYRRDLAMLYLRMTQVTAQPELRKLYISQAHVEIDRAFKARPVDPYLFFLRGRANLLSGDFGQAESNYKEALRHDPFMLFSAYRDLSSLYFRARDYRSVVLMLNPVLAVYDSEVFNSIAWINPYKDETKKEVADLWSRLGAAQMGLDNRVGAEIAFLTAQSFSPLEEKAKRGLACLNDFKSFWSGTDLYGRCARLAGSF